MLLKPHPIIPELLALLEKHGATIGVGTDEGVHLSVGGEDVLICWGSDLRLKELREAAAQCPQPTVEPQHQLEELLTKHRLAIVPMGGEWCAFFPAPSGGFSVKAGYIDVTDMDADGRGATPLEAARNALEKTR